MANYISQFVKSTLQNAHLIKLKYINIVSILVIGLPLSCFNKNKNNKNKHNLNTLTMAISFHPDSKKSINDSVSVHRDKHGCIYLDFDGYYIYLPQAHDFCGVVEHLIIMQESFQRGFILVDSLKS